MQARQSHAPDWEHLVFLSAIVAFLIWYAWDATAASPTFSNLILIAPAAAAAFALALYIATAEIFGRGAPPRPIGGEPGEAEAPAETSRFRTTAVGIIAGLMTLFAAFVIAIPYAGFDIATFAFVVMTLWLLGECRVIVTLALALIITAGVSAAALLLLAVPMPMMVAGRLWSAL